MGTQATDYSCVDLQATYSRCQLISNLKEPERLTCTCPGIGSPFRITLAAFGKGRRSALTSREWQGLRVRVPGGQGGGSIVQTLILLYPYSGVRVITLAS